MQPTTKNFKFQKFNQQDIFNSFNRAPHNGNFHKLTLPKRDANALRKIFNTYNGPCDLLCNQITHELSKEYIKRIDEFVIRDVNPLNQGLVPFAGTHALELKGVYRTLQLLICTLFRYYPDSPEGFHWNHWALNANFFDNGLWKRKDNAINKVLSDMKEADCYKLCTIERNNFGIPIGGHSMLIHKLSDNTFSFFDPVVGCYSDINQAEVTDIIKLHAQMDEIAIMDNKKFLTNHHPNLLKNAINSIATANSTNHNETKEDTLWDEFFQTIKKDLEENAVVKAKLDSLKNFSYKLDISVIGDVNSDQLSTKDEILDNVQNILNTNNDTEDTLIFIKCFIEFLKKHPYLEGNDMRSDTTKDKDKIKNNDTEINNIESATKALKFQNNSLVAHYSQKLIKNKKAITNGETQNKTQQIFEKQQGLFIRYIEEIKKETAKELQK